MEEQERHYIPGLGTLLLAILLLGALGALLHDFNGVGYEALGALVWGGGVLVTFVLGTAYLSRRLLPLQGNLGWSEGFRLLWRNYTMGAANLLYGRPQENPAAAASARKKKKTPQPTLAPSFRLLGAGFLFSHEAAAITRGNSYSRADGPGLVFLHAGESIAQVFDLRPQSRRMAVSALTRDGIPIETSVSVTFQVRRIPPGSRRPRSVIASAGPYPYDGAALFDLVYVASVAGEDRRGWTEQVCPQAATLLVTEIAKYTLDELLVGAGAEPLGKVKDSVKAALLKQQQPGEEQTQTLPAGIEIVGVNVGGLELPEDVVAKRLSTWQVTWQSRISEQIVAGDIEANRLYQQARAQAQIENIERLLTSIETMRRHGGVELHEVVMLRLMEIVEAISANRTIRRLDSQGEIGSLTAEASSALRRTMAQEDGE